MEAFLFLANQRSKRDHARQLALYAAGARGDPEAVRKQIRDLEEGKL